ncbi:hypothetical protein J6590_097708 [Homalodisca vitripennis]|nr:hypothetical protein J6590_055202 [Homalodisca vitripennis]KAG8334099.1 hypothetical protein J6590_097708 [Homalodisca vitripennis]
MTRTPGTVLGVPVVTTMCEALRPMSRSGYTVSAGNSPIVLLRLLTQTPLVLNLQLEDNRPLPSRLVVSNTQ